MKTSNIIYLALALVVIAGLAFWLLPRQGGEESLKTYTNQEFGISFRYPSGYLLDERRNVGERKYQVSLVEDNETNRQILAGENEVPTEGPVAITLEVLEREGDDNLATWLRTSTSSNYQLSDSSYSSTTVANVSALRYSWDGLYQGDSVALSHRDNILVFSATYNAPSDKTIQDFPKILETVELQ